MNINPVSLLRFNSFKTINKNNSINTTDYPKNDIVFKPLKTSYPNNYYINNFNQISFGTNIDEFEKMKSAKSVEEQIKLFKKLTQTAQDNVNGVVDKFFNEGLTLESYLPACVKQTQLFNQIPDTIEGNVRGLVDKFSKNGLTIKSYLSACLKNPPLFYQSPDTIAEHIDILRLVHYNNEEEIDTGEFFDKILRKPIELSFSSKLLLIKYLIIPKMFENHPIPKELKGSRLEKKLIEYIKNNPDKQYQINIKNIEAESDIIKVINSTFNHLSEQAKTKNVFDLNIDET